MQAAALGAFYGGAILTESPRQVTPAHAREVFNAAPSLTRVGVVGRDSISRLLRMADEAQLDVLQVHAHLTPNEHAALRAEFDGAIWSVIGIDAESGNPAADWKAIADLSDAILLDTSARGRSGGTGRSFNWEKAQPLVHSISQELSVVLAGGLNPENVADAVRILHPAVVDVSSGVEVEPGKKSAEKMASFAQAVASASIV